MLHWCLVYSPWCATGSFSVKTLSPPAHTRGTLCLNLVIRIASVPVLHVPCYEVLPAMRCGLSALSRHLHSIPHPPPFTGCFQVETQLSSSHCKCACCLLFCQTNSPRCKFSILELRREQDIHSSSVSFSCSHRPVCSPGVLTCSAFSPHDLHL